MTQSFGFRHWIALLLASFTLAACGKGFDLSKLGSLNQSSDQDSPSYNYEPLLWESVKSGSKSWSDSVFNLLQGDAQALLQAQDFDLFCPKYHFLGLEQKINVAGMLISAIVKFESNFNPTTRYHETSMGNDEVTGLPLYSEGLMQLSYQDVTGWPFCAFDWSKDQNLSPTDPQKTILNPLTNLACGVRILAQQVEKKGKIVLGTGAYWAVIKDNSSNQKISEIAALVSKLEFCQ